jgi:hypothetical protein
MGYMKNAYKILVGKLDGLRHTWKIVLKWILGKQGGKVWTGCIWLRIGTSGGM